MMPTVLMGFSEHSSYNSRNNGNIHAEDRVRVQGAAQMIRRGEQQAAEELYKKTTETLPPSLGL